MAAVVRALCPSLRPRTGTQLVGLMQVLAQRLEHYTVAELTAALPVTTVQVANPAGFVAKAVPLVPLREPAAAPRPDWCGMCAESTRMVETDDDRVMRCPVCHPLIAAVGAAS